MKKLILIAASLMMLLSCTPKTETSLKGKIIGYNGEETMIFYMDKASGEYKDIIIPVEEDGTFDATFELDSSLFDCAIFMDKFMFLISLEQGKSYTAEFDITVEGVETNYKFIGEGAAENEFTRDFGNGFGAAYEFIDSKNTVNGFKAYCDIIAKGAGICYNQLKKIDNKPFCEFYEQEIASCELQYKLCYPYLALKEAGKVVVDSDYEAFIASEPLASLTDEEIQTVSRVVNAFTAFDKSNIIDILNIAAGTTADAGERDFLVSNTMHAYMSSGNTDKIKEAFKYYNTLCTNEYYTSEVAVIYNSMVNLVKGAKAPDIEFKDIDGKVYHLADFKGRKVYVDLWASWCVPCCEEIPYLAKLVEKTSSRKDLVIISISTDMDEEAWKAKISEDKPAWPQFIASEKGQTDISKAYNVNAIPRFMLFDAAGRIITVDAPRPSEDEIMDYLK